MRRWCSSLVVLVSASATSGCALSGAEESIADTALSLATHNALTANALTANALFPQALSASALAEGPLSLEGLSDDARAAIEDPGPAGDLSRRLLKYAVGCALDASRVFAFSWTDAAGAVHQESYPGSLGIAPAWAQGPLNAPSRRMVSACLGARVNYYGITVAISARSATAPLDVLGDDEVSAYPHLEGAFWGDVFTDAPYLNACFDAAGVANAHARLRDCASGHVNADGTISPCGMIRLAGDCAAVCPDMDAEGRYHRSCFDGPAAGGSPTAYVVTIALP